MLKNVEKSYTRNCGAGLVGQMIGLVIGIVLSVAVVIPITSDVITDVNATGTTAVILNIIPIFVALIPIIFHYQFVRLAECFLFFLWLPFQAPVTFLLFLPEPA